MNHRDLMLARAKRARFKFLDLPGDLQDEIIDGLDRKDLTGESAADLARSHGHEIGFRSILRYYEALRRERALQIRRERLEQNIAALVSIDPDEAARTYMKLVVDLGAEAIMAAGGDAEAMKNACVAASSAIHAVADLTRARTTEKKVEGELVKLVRGRETKAGKKMTEEEGKRYVREQIYGIV